MTIWVHSVDEPVPLNTTGVVCTNGLGVWNADDDLAETEACKSLYWTTLQKLLQVSGYSGAPPLAPGWNKLGKNSFPAEQVVWVLNERTDDLCVTAGKASKDLLSMYTHWRPAEVPAARCQVPVARAPARKEVELRKAFLESRPPIRRGAKP